ncbi:MAG: hypothetical protein NZU63_15020, partial [Gemmataceae bacterium]|nr:hypothetical protein [Gemmataceae bacterium]MDW8244901.1 hypothetical protein [Thermogemmata sp.]
MLNAFRHHCIQHPPGRSQPASRLSFVLNAFRHHCIQHGDASTNATSPIMCSTPFGITAFNTFWLTSPVPFLNL